VILLNLHPGRSIDNLRFFSESEHTRKPIVQYFYETYPVFNHFYWDNVQIVLSWFSMDKVKCMISAHTAKNSRP